MLTVIYIQRLRCLYIKVVKRETKEIIFKMVFNIAIIFSIRMPRTPRCYIYK